MDTNHDGYTLSPESEAVYNPSSQGMSSEIALGVLPMIFLYLSDWSFREAKIGQK